MKIPFDIKFRPQIESGEYKVETRSGKHATNFQFRKWGEMDSVWAYFPGTETWDIYDTEGHVRYDGKDDDSDLFLVTPEPEMTAFEYAMLRYVQEGANAKSDEELEELTKKHSTELLAIAREELRDEIEFRGKEYQTGYKKGQADLLKDLPRWKKTDYCPGQKDHKLYYDEKKDMILLDGYYLTTNDVKKLPGFQED